MVKKLDGEHYDEHKAKRDEHKSMSLCYRSYFADHMGRENKIHKSREAEVQSEEDGC